MTKQSRVIIRSMTSKIKNRDGFSLRILRSNADNSEASKATTHLKVAGSSLRIGSLIKG